MKQLPFFFAIIFLFGVLFFGSCKKSEVVPTTPNPTSPVEPSEPESCQFINLKIDGAICAFDAASKTFFYPISSNLSNFSPLIEVEETAIDILFQQKEITNAAVNDLGEVFVNQIIPIEFTLCDATKLSYELVLTGLPIIQIETNGQSIQDEPKIPASFLLNDPNFDETDPSTRFIESTIGIEIRGGSSQSYDKKAYALELWVDENGEETANEKLLDIRNDDDWILDGMSNDVSRMRNRVSMDVWRNFSKLPYELQEPKANNGTTGKLVELFINEEYRGVYALSDRIDRKLLKLKKIEDGLDFGVLYKSVAWGRGVVTFKEYFDFDERSATWEGWEQKYPDPESEGIFWEPIADFTKFAVTASDADFSAKIANYLDLENAADYFIFLNLIRGDDNTGKNIYLAKYDKETPFMIVPWDVDATWGLFWDRTRTSPNDIILSNHLFNRLIDLDVNGFRSKLKDRWQKARNEEFSHSSIMAYFDNYAEQMLDNDSFERERQKWNVDASLENELSFIDGWVGQRLTFLDTYFDDLSN